MKKIALLAVAVVCLVMMAGMSIGAVSDKDKKIVPGGQNQIDGVEGKAGEWVFNGTTKFMVTEIDTPEAGPNGEKAEAGKKWIMIKAEIKNAHDFTSTYGGPFQSIDLVDYDGNLVEGVKVVKATDWTKQEGGKRLLPAAGMKAVFAKRIEKDYNPIRLIFHAGAKEPVFRIAF